MGSSQFKKTAVDSVAVLDVGRGTGSIPRLGSPPGINRGECTWPEGAPLMKTVHDRKLAYCAY